mmetsp:Transcript_3560/g.5827  ORF Transcript_3560/g.5827 Transcript_3560/m.5827 type:complete len:312 (+) Transcript_3560:24-959(+)
MLRCGILLSALAQATGLLAVAAPPLDPAAQPFRSAALPRTTAPLLSSAAPPPTMMEEGIYNFNKLVIDSVYDLICLLYSKNDLRKHSIAECTARFYVLETVARVPYFAYLSVMHLRESLGSRVPGDKDRMRTHYAEADNELHHLLIMESLGGNSSIVDRTLAQTMAFGYYWYVTLVYSVSEQAAYHLSELIEDHAFNTYNTFLEVNEEALKTMPVPAIAQKYYEQENPFLFDLFCTVKEPDTEPFAIATRPKLESLYDVFVNVRNDEREHWKTLCNLVQYDDMAGTGSAVISTAIKPKELATVGTPGNDAY